MSIKLIVALDFDNINAAMALVDKLDPETTAVKIGSELFTRFGTGLVRQLVAKSYQVFLDLKYHDIPNTVAQACKAAADLGVWMMNVHASGGFAMLEAARQALEPYGNERPLLIAVTVLTSMSATELPSIGVQAPLLEQVCELARLAKIAGLDGVVCSAHEAIEIKAICGDEFLAVTPGIRLADNALDDQSRIITPELALAAGSDYLVVGRPITRATHPETVIQQIQTMIRNHTL